MSGFRSTRLTSAIATALLLLLGLVVGPVVAQSAPNELDSLQAPPRALAAPPPVVTDATTPAVAQGPEQRVALVIGNASYQSAPELDNPDNDARSVAQLLNSAGFEVIAATNLTQNDMIKVVQDFSSRIAAHGPNTVAMIYYAGHGVQLAGENYLIPVDARISAPSDLTNGAIRLVDLMATLDAIPSRMRVVVLDACRNNPFPAINDAGRGLAIVDAPNGSIVGYSTSPGEEALDGRGDHSPYTQAFLNLARQPNLPIEQLFKRIRLQVNQTTDGQQTPWESSSLTTDFTFFGDAAVTASRLPERAPVVQMASNLPGRSVRQAYDYVLSEGKPEHYREFIQMFPRDPLADRIRALLTDLVQAAAWHEAVLANSPVAYKTFSDNYADSPYAPIALRLQAEPRRVPVLQPTRLMMPPRLTPMAHPVTTPQFNAGPSKIATAPVSHGAFNPGSKIGPVPRQSAPHQFGHGPATLQPNHFANASSSRRPFRGNGSPFHQMNASHSPFQHGPASFRGNSGPHFSGPHFAQSGPRVGMRGMGGGGGFRGFR
jgi:hypothetical protein